MAHAVLLMQEGMKELHRVMRALGQRADRLSPQCAALLRLTRTEGLVLHALVTSDDTLDTLAGRLGMHRRTLGGHITKLCKKLHVQSTRGLVRVAVMAGWG